MLIVLNKNIKELIIFSEWSGLINECEECQFLFQLTNNRLQNDVTRLSRYENIIFSLFLSFINDITKTLMSITQFFSF